MNVLAYFPSKLSTSISKVLDNEKDELLEEIRLRAGKQVILKFSNKDVLLNEILTVEEVSRILQALCENSIYSYQNQICNGFITISRWS
jgi:stage III sporulation protein SpoIIIAA